MRKRISQRITTSEASSNSSILVADDFGKPARLRNEKRRIKVKPIGQITLEYLTGMAMLTKGLHRPKKQYESAAR